MDYCYQWFTSLDRLDEEGDMRFTHDPRYNVAYIRFKEKQTEVEAV